MKRAMYGVVLAFVLAAVGIAGAQQAAAPVMGEVKVPVRQYKKLTPTAVYRAALDGVRADVSFRDSFADRMDVPPTLRSMGIRNANYAIVAAFRTEGGLLCLVPSASGQALRSLFRLSPNQEITPAVVGRPMAIDRGQQITIEGALAGTGANQKLVVVDSVFVYGSKDQEAQREVQLLWPGAEEALVITEPGTVTVPVPCTAQENRAVSLKVTVQAMTPDGLREYLAGTMAAMQGKPGAKKAYGQFDAETVYRHAAADNQVNVDFTDTVLGVFGDQLPRDLTTIPVVRNGRAVPAPTGYAFEVGTHLACLVPVDLPTPMARASSAMEGERIRIRGTTVGRRGGYSIVAVDSVSFPDQEAEADRDDVWLVTLEWPGTRPREFWDYGLYRLVDLPCQSVPGRFETLQLMLGEFRTYEVPLPTPAAPAPTPVGPEG
jgi:hypothetical protein